jgi:hypothetical protein
VVENGADQRLLGREVIVQGGDVDPDLGRDLTRAQALEATLGDLAVSREDE